MLAPAQHGYSSLRYSESVVKFQEVCVDANKGRAPQMVVCVAGVDAKLPGVCRTGVALSACCQSRPALATSTQCAADSSHLEPDSYAVVRAASTPAPYQCLRPACLTSRHSIVGIIGLEALQVWYSVNDMRLFLLEHHARNAVGTKDRSARVPATSVEQQHEHLHVSFTAGPAVTRTMGTE